MKKWLCAWLALLMALCLTACGGAAESGATESPDLLDVARGARRNVSESDAESADDNGSSDDIEEILADIEGMLADNRQFKEFPDELAPYAQIPAESPPEELPAENEPYADSPAYEDASAYGESGATESPAYDVSADAPSDTFDAPSEPAPEARESVAEPETPDAPALREDGSYTSKEDVALYLHLYRRLPGNFITKEEARSLGWDGGSVEPYAPGKCIGGDYFGNYERLLPQGRSYHECDIDTLGAKSRGAKRIVYSDDGLIYYTDDHYNTFTLLYGEE